MSKIGKLPITIPEGVTVTIDGGTLHVKGAKGEVSLPILQGVGATLENGILTFVLQSTSKQARSNWGTMRALTANTIQGFVKEFEKGLILEGVGYRITKEGEGLTLNLGFSHPVKYDAPKGITFEVEKNSRLKIRGTDKALVGQVAAQIRAMKKPEPYKGKGFRYEDEVIRRKVGKKAGTGSGS